MKEGWYEDPSDRHDFRWFSQGAPTDLVRDGAVTSRDPISVTDPAAFESMELKRPADNASWRQSGSAFAQRLARTPRASELLVVVLPLPVGLVLLALHQWIGVIVLLAIPVLGFVWLPWRRTRPGRIALGTGKWRSRAYAAMAVVLVAALGWAAYWWTASSSPPAGPGSYLLAARASLVFVQWHQPTSSGAVTGTITFAYLTGKPPAEIVSLQSTPFTGQLAGSANFYANYPSISLTVSHQDFGSGTFQNGKLVLNVPGEPSPNASTYVLVRSDPAAYKTALRMLTAREQLADKTAVPR